MVTVGTAYICSSEQKWQTQVVNLTEFFAKKCEIQTACTLSEVISLLSEIELYANGKKEIEAIRKERD
ncbi:hypothetical protein QMO40_03725 [Mannheimia bovis]|uniref:hypothetical protein n=1 Tax=Mannheimia bovis TaxID=2770636 RepID=UPI0024B7C34D|nr:hypothetical protein [Mannheimia bovis]WHP47778.1 hypothetical protein QMO40_03725 [Mannheimia bovis]